MDALKIISEGSIKAEKPQFNVGDTVRVDVRIKEGDRERIQAFEGTVIAKKHGGVAETFTVRRVSYGVGVERVFPGPEERLLGRTEKFWDYFGQIACICGRFVLSY